MLPRSCYWFSLLIALSTACGGGGGNSGGADASTASHATTTFSPPEAGVGADFGAIPYPSDLYLDASGHLAVTKFPVGAGADPFALMLLGEGLATMDGPGVRSNVYFPVTGKVAAASVASAAKIIDLDASTAGHLVEVPADVVWRDDLATVIASPKPGVVLRFGHRYGAYLTSAAIDDAGTPIRAASGFVEALGTATPSTAGIAGERVSLKPLLDLLGADVRATLVSATVFRTATTGAQTRAMRDVVAAHTPTITVTSVYGPGETGTTGLQFVVGNAPADGTPGTDLVNHGAQPHNHVALIVHGTIALPNFLSTDFKVDGFPDFTSGSAAIKATASVPFTLSLPKTASWSNLPVVVYIAGLTRPRIDMLTQINTAGRDGIAVLAIDMRYHGSRAKNAKDVTNELLDNGVPDGIGDSIGLSSTLDLFHFGPSGGIPAYHPEAMGENLRQAALEVDALVEYVCDGDTAPLEAAVAGITGVPHTIAFKKDVGLLTESLGGLIGGTVLAVEPRLGVAYISASAAGFPFPSMIHSPNYSAQFLQLLSQPYDVQDRVVLFDPTRDARFEPMIMFFDNVLERGDALAYAPDVADGALRGDSGPDVVLSESWGDVWVSNDTQEGYASAMGLPYMPFPAAPTQPPMPDRFVPLPMASGPVSGNRAGGARTGAFVAYHPAGHGALRRYLEERNFEPTYPPFVQLDPATPIPDTQELQSHAVWSTLMSQHFAGTTPTVVNPYAP